MCSKMTHWERFRAALKGEETDRVPISLWRHWPTHEETMLGLVACTVRWQKEYDFDMIKITPRGTYSVEDWGAVAQYIPNANGVQSVIKTAISAPEDYARLDKLDVHKGCLGDQLEATRRIVDELGHDAPYLMTVFNPMTVALKMAGPRVLADLRRHPDLVKEGLQTIAETVIDFCLESIKAGANGIFFATQSCSYRQLNEAEYQEFSEHYDRLVLDSVRPEAEILLLHIHGEDTMIDALASYPVDAYNWHDRLVGPSLAEARSKLPGMLVGGINEWNTLLNDSPADVTAEIQDAIEQVNGRGLMLGPGCVLPVTTPVKNIRAARHAVEP